MGPYIIRRLLIMGAMLVGMSMIVFLLFTAVPADPARLTCGKACTPSIIQANKVKLGLDKPLYEQYGAFVSGIFVGRDYGQGSAQFHCPAPCLGYSFLKNANVTDLITETLPITVNLAIGAFILWMFFGISTGVLSALQRGRWPDRATMGFALVGYSFPIFFIGLLLLFFVQIKWHLIPVGLAYTPIYENPLNYFQVMLLPWVTLAWVYAAFYARLTRNQMLETLGEDYIRTARAKGLSERVVIGKHALRAGLTPIVTAAGIDLAGVLGGAFVTESIFRLNGMGRLALDSVFNTDLPITLATVLVAATFIILANLIVDLLYAVIDPRVRLV